MAILLFSSVLCMVSKKEKGEVIIPPDVNVWPHELCTAKALAAEGYTVRFIRKSERFRENSADVLINGVLWDMKAPTSAYIQRVGENLREALRQSRYVVFDSRRMKKIPDSAIERELRKWAKELKRLKALKYVDKHGQVFDIK